MVMQILETEKERLVRTTHIKRLTQANQIIFNFSEAIKNITFNGSFNETIDKIRECEGSIITAGIGKAGIAMRKFSSLLCSQGIPSCYLHPGEASHGDLGVITNKDILFVASTSGKTREIMEVIDLARGVNVQTVIGLTSHKDSPIREKADVVIDMGIITEEGHLGLAPTTSILVMLAITDTITLIVSEEKGLTKEDYLKLHHSGYIGTVVREKLRENRAK